MLQVTEKDYVIKQHIFMIYFQWSVLTCGHCYCLECIRLMIDKYSFGGRQRSMKCAICRQLAHISDISYVCTKESRMEETDNNLRVAVSTFQLDQ